jgi:hypothetical protein
MNEIWALPNHPTIITNWSDCTGQQWPPAGEGNTPFDGFYANQCQAGPYNFEGSNVQMPGIIATLKTGLPDRKNAHDQGSGIFANPFPERPGYPMAGL